MRVLSAILVLILAGLFLPNGNAGTPSPTAISYQGKLENGGNAANGVFDFEFSLWDAETNGTQIGAPILVEDVVVDDGIFTVELDFGGAAFNGSLRWLTIKVALANNVLTTLTPRQQVTATPVALYALDSPGGGAGGTLDEAYDSGGPGAGREIVADSDDVYISGPDGLRVDSGVLAGSASLGRPTATFDVQARHSFNVIGGEPPGPSTVGSFIRDGNIIAPRDKWTYIRVAPVGNAIRRDSGSSLAFDVEATPNNDTSWFTQMILDGDGNLGLGTISPESHLHVFSGAGASVSGGGYLVLGNTQSTNIVMDNNEIMARNNGVASRLILNNVGGNVTISAGNSGGNLGIGTNNPQGRLHIEGASDVSLAGGGGVIVGSLSSANVAMDGNEIMARNNGGTASLNLNAEGGIVTTGGDLRVDGTLDIGYQIVSQSAVDQTVIQANCPAGKKAISGGLSMSPNNEYGGSFPSANGNSWSCRLVDQGGAATCYAVCARVN